MVKEKYIKLIRLAGFQKVKITGETPFLVEEYIADNLTAKTIIENSNISSEKVKEIGILALSVAVEGIKPQ